MTLDDILARLDNVQGHGGQRSARCPAHDDHANSLSVSAGKDGRILLKCHAGCTAEEICGALGITAKDLFPAAPSPKATSKRKIVARYDYYDRNGVFLYQKTRWLDEAGKKSFTWSHKDSTGRWQSGRGDAPLILYNEWEALEHDRVFLVEGEKDVETMRTRLHLPAVSTPDGADKTTEGNARKWRPHFTEALTGKSVVIIPDNDGPGKTFAQYAASVLHGKAASVKLLDLKSEWDKLPEHGDITDVLEAVGDPQKVAFNLEALETMAKEYIPEEAPPSDEKSETHALQVVTAPELLAAEYPPAKYFVDDFLPEGTSLLSAPSKVGKSWMVLDMSLSIAGGWEFMGRKTNQAGVLYFALEDSPRRIQGRMRKLLNGRKPPPLLSVTTDAPTLDNGFLDVLDEHLKAHPAVELVIIDTLQKIRGAALPRETPYAQDYREIGTIKKFLDARKKSVYFVHHNRKMKDDDDPFNMISGTNGIMGAADTIHVITKDKRTSENSVLHITGRDIVSQDIEIKFNQDSGHWESLGDANWLAREREKLAYESSPIVETIKELLRQSPKNRWDGTASKLLEAGRYIAKTELAVNAQKLGFALKPLKEPLLKYDGIVYERTGNGSGAGKHHFYYSRVEDTDTWEEIDAEQKNLPFS